MEYKFPSQFDENGFNMLSPNYAMYSGGVGNTTSPAFKYNGGTTQETYATNQQQQQYYYPNFGVNQQHTQQMPDYDYYTRLGAYANQQMQIQQQLYQPQPQPQYQQQYGWTAYQEPTYDPGRAEAYRQSYNNGLLSLSDYCYYCNAGINPQAAQQQQATTFYGADGRMHTIGGSGSAYDGWYNNMAYSMQAQMEYQKQAQEEYQNQLDCWNLVARVCARGLGIEETQIPDYSKQIETQQKWQKYYADMNQLAYQQDCFSAQMKAATKSSLDKDYISPLKQMMIDNWNKLYHERNDKLPEHYGLDEFFNHGIMEGQILDDLDYRAKQKAKQLDQLYDKQEFRNLMHQLHPNYDPYSGISIGGAGRLGIDDIEITLPPHLAQQQYKERKDRFLNSIYANNTANYHTLR